MCRSPLYFFFILMIHYATQMPLNKPYREGNFISTLGQFLHSFPWLPLTILYHRVKKKKK